MCRCKTCRHLALMVAEPIQRQYHALLVVISSPAIVENCHWEAGLLVKIMWEVGGSMQTTISAVCGRQCWLDSWLIAVPSWAQLHLV